jgi:Asp23 family, cell envelope-related function
VTEPLVFRGPEGSITVTAGALTRLVARAAQSVDGARVRRPKRAVEVAHGGGRVSVSIELSARHGVPLPELARSVQERVASALARVSGLELERVDVEIAEVS